MDFSISSRNLPDMNATLVDILDRRKGLDRAGVTFIAKSNCEDFLSYEDLYSVAVSVLSYFQRCGLRPKDELVFQVENNKTFVVSFWACILGGIIPVPLSLGQSEDHKQKLLNVWPVLNNPYLLISTQNMARLKMFAEQNGFQELMRHIADRSVDEGDIMTSESGARIFKAQPDDIAFIQFSSGSTGKPKGVVLTHKNLIANMGAISSAAGYTSEDVMLSWMPLTHDMGLIGFHLNPLYCGMNHYILPTALFIRRPGLWLEKASAHKASILCSPNFGYEYVLKHGDAPEQTDWDLSTVRIIYNGAEPISEKLCHGFLKTFAPHKLKHTAMRPVYGLAEASLAVSISKMDDPVISLYVDRSKLRVGNKISILDGQNGHAVSFVNVGKPIDHCAIRISTDENVTVAEETVGHVQIKGTSITSGYYNSKEETNVVMTEDGWLKTGDIGFIKEGALYITGRAKDIFFVNGQNYYPQDVERIAEQVNGIELNKIAVAGFFNNETQQEEMVAFVFHRGDLKKFIPLKVALTLLINDKLGLEITKVIPVKDIPRTTSGKLQRFRLLEQYRNGEFEAVESALNDLVFEAHDATKQASPGAEDETERRLMGIWKRVLRNNSLDMAHNFMEVGGNSLKAAELQMLILKEFHVELPLDTIYQYQTVKALSRQIKIHDKVKYENIAVVSRRDFYPVSSAQRRLYYIWRIDRSSTAYNIPVAFRITGRIALDIFESCVRRLIDRHDMLRASFVLKEEPVVQVAETTCFDLDCLACERNALDEKLRSLVVPFDLEAPPLFRIKLIKIADAEYVLFADFHHIISDGMSVFNFMEELVALYSGRNLPTLAIQFKDYTYWEARHLQSQQLESQKRYWTTRLSGQLPMLDLPLDFTRPAMFNTAGGKLEFSLDKMSTQRLKKLADNAHTSLHAVMFTLYYILLAKYTGQNDMIIGIPVSSRRHPDVQGLQGLFVNNLAISVTRKEARSFAELLGVISDDIRDAMHNQDCPFEYVLQTVGQQRDVSRNPLFDTMFVYQNMGLPVNAGPDFTMSRYFFDPGFSKYDLSCEVFDDGEAIKYSFEYATSLFQKETIIRLAVYFGNLVSEVVADSNRSIADLRLMKDIGSLVDEFNATRVPYPDNKTIHRLFEEQVIKSPANVALEYGEEELTYKELDARANALTKILIGNGITHGCAVGILLARKPELIISILAVLKAGACYLPIDQDLPAERIRFLISNSQCKIVICEPESDVATLFHDLPGVCVVNPTDLRTVNTTHTALSQQGTAHDLAYMIYTSGTTGNPKGVMITHRSLVNYANWSACIYVGHGETAFPLYTPVSFDLTVTSIFVPLITGNKIVIYGSEQNSLVIDRVIADNKVHVMKLTPSHLKILAYNNFIKQAVQSKLKAFIVGGEKLESSLAGDIQRKFGGVKIYNEYGPTEATVGCMIHKYDECNDRGLSVPIGKPINNTKVYLLDADLRHVPIGVKGEIFISGDGIAVGYKCNDGLTSEKFIPDPFIKGAIMYRTGDLAIRHADSKLEYVGRIDEQVKINGYRIELGEIESCLKANPGIKEVAVLKKTDGNQEYLCAYYVGATGKQTGADELARFLSLKLPFYMIPGHFVQVHEIPLTLNGKVDTRKLPLPRAAMPQPAFAAKNEVEQVLMEVWCDVLNRENIDLQSNFLAVGGDSIKAVQISARLFEKDISLNPKDILMCQSIEQILLRGKITQSVNRYEQGQVRGYKGLSPIEYWFFRQRLANENYYNQSVLLTLTTHADVNPRHIELAIGEVIKHHDGLRLNYNSEAKTLYFNNEQKIPFTLDIYDITFVERNDIQAEVAKVCVDIKRRIDIGNGCLLRAALFRLKQGSDLLFITVHHLGIDGISWRILLDDIRSTYLAIAGGKKIALPRKTASLLDWYNRLYEYSRADDLLYQFDYWKEVDEMVVGRAPVLAVRTPERMTAQIGEAATSTLINDATRFCNADAQAVLLTALTLALEEWGVVGPVIELEHHGRSVEGIDVSRTVGWFTAMYPVRLVVAGKDDVKLQIRSVNDQIAAVPGNGIGYGILKYMNGALPQDTGMPLLRFNYLGQFDRELNNELFSFSGFDCGAERSSDNATTADIEINSMVLKGGLRIEVLYNASKYSREQISALLNTFVMNLDNIVRHVAEKIDDIQLTPEDFDAVALDQDDLNLIFKD